MKTAEDLLNEKGSEIVSVSPETTISEALQLMVEKRIGAVAVQQGGQFVGIWTERDLMRNSLDENFAPRTAKIGDYMTTNLITAPHDSPIISLADKFIGKHLRHLFIEREGRIIGLLSAKDIIKFNLQEKAQALDDLNEIVHLEFYEEWRWKQKKSK